LFKAAGRYWGAWDGSRKERKVGEQADGGEAVGKASLEAEKAGLVEGVMEKWGPRKGRGMESTWAKREGATKLREE